MNMKAKSLGVIALLLATILWCMAEWIPENKRESKASLNASWTYTSAVSHVQRISSILTLYSAAATGNQVVSYTPKGGSAVEIRVSSLDANTSHYIGGDIFEALFIYTGDTLTITNSCAVTNDLTVALEGVR